MSASSAAATFLDQAAAAVVDTSFQPIGVLPGDDVTAVAARVSRRLALGDGLVQQGEAVIAVRAGVLRYRPPNRYWVEHNQRKYIPAVEDFAVGTVTARSADFYTVDVGGPTAALLPTLAFDGATKRNRPNLQVGDLLYARVVDAPKDMEPELSCCAVHGAKKDWMTGDATYGELREGHVFTCSVALARQLLRADSPVLRCLAGCTPFELAIGHNGRVWVNSGSPPHTIFIANALANSELLSPEQVELMVQRLWATMKKQMDARERSDDDEE
jgi:exosome complex component RRP40